MNLAIVENYNYHTHILGGDGMNQYRFYADRNYLYKVFPKSNNLIINWDKNDILCRFGHETIISSYKYKNSSKGLAFINEWIDNIGSYTEDNYFHHRSNITDIRCVFIKSVYHINNIAFVEINHPVMNFFNKIKQYYSNKIKMKKKALSRNFLLNRQIYGKKTTNQRPTNDQTNDQSMIKPTTNQ